MRVTMLYALLFSVSTVAAFPEVSPTKPAPQALAMTSGSDLDGFGSPLGGAEAESAFQRGVAQVAVRDNANEQAKEQATKLWKQVDNADTGAARNDNQERKGSLAEKNFKNQDQQTKGSQSQLTNSFDQSHDQAVENGHKKVSVNDKHAGGFQHNGRYNRKDVASNAGKKALSASKNAFTRHNKGGERIDYGFNKDFKTNFNEKGGFHEAVGQDNNNMDVYEEKQKDNRMSKGFLDAFRRSNDNSALWKSSDWASKAAQSQNVNNNYGADDWLKNSAKERNADWNSLFDRRNDVFWHRDSAQDKAQRQANDVADKKASQHKNALAQASGNKGVQDSKYYGGGTFGSGSNAGSAAGSNNNPIAGHDGAAVTYGSVAGPGHTGAGHVSGSGIVQPGSSAGQSGSGKVKGRQEGSGGAYVNHSGEKAKQTDNAGQSQANTAQSDAKASNDYKRGRGVDDSVEVNGKREGKWSKDQEGLRDAKSQGYNGAKAGATKDSQLADKTAESRHSSSNLDAANKNLQAQELDRQNFKRNEVDSNQKVRKLKKFYHDKNEDGYNNEALNYARNQTNQETGNEQQAHKEARTSYNNAADDAKINQQGRAYDNLDARNVSTAKALSKDKNNAEGWKTSKQADDSNAAKSKASASAGKQTSELDSFARNVNNRNQQLWDKARKDLAQRDQGSDQSRSLDASFVFAPRSSNTMFGLGKKPEPATSTSVDRNPAPSRGFTSGFNSKLGNFMGDIGSTKFGQHSFGKSTPTRFSGSYGESDDSGSSWLGGSAEW